MGFLVDHEPGRGSFLSPEVSRSQGPRHLHSCPLLLSDSVSPAPVLWTERCPPPEIHGWEPYPDVCLGQETGPPEGTKFRGPGRITPVSLEERRPRSCQASPCAHRGKDPGGQETGWLSASQETAPAPTRSRASRATRGGIRDIGDAPCPACGRGSLSRLLHPVSSSPPPTPGQGPLTPPIFLPPPTPCHSPGTFPKQRSGPTGPQYRCTSSSVGRTPGHRSTQLAQGLRLQDAQVRDSPFNPEMASRGPSSPTCGAACRLEPACTTAPTAQREFAHEWRGDSHTPRAKETCAQSATFLLPFFALIASRWDSSSPCTPPGCHRGRVVVCTEVPGKPPWQEVTSQRKCGSVAVGHHRAWESLPMGPLGARLSQRPPLPASCLPATICGATWHLRGQRPGCQGPGALQGGQPSPNSVPGTSQDSPQGGSNLPSAVFTIFFN